MAFEVRMYCDTCGTNMLVDEQGEGSFREATREAIENALRRGFQRTRKGWQCPGCLVGFPNAFDIGATSDEDWQRRLKAKAAYSAKYGKTAARRAYLIPNAEQ